jgi:hypothetical protein
MSFLTLPIFAELESSRRILIAGAGGGFDIFCGLPLYFGLQAAGKQVFLANMSFSVLEEGAGRWLTPVVVEVTADSSGRRDYFPEYYLSRWFRKQGQEVPIYAFPKTGVAPLTEAYEALVNELELDTVLLVDGGTDSLMRGDEAGLGTPTEDITSIAAVHGLQVPKKLLACLGFGIDTFHGVCHADFLEAVAELTRQGAFLGAWTLTAEMPEVQRYSEATLDVFRATPRMPSIVSASILSAVAGQFDDYHATDRTRGSKLFINPLMTLYWCFQLDPVARRLLYPEELYWTSTMEEVHNLIRRFREGCAGIKQWRDLPV